MANGKLSRLDVINEAEKHLLAQGAWAYLPYTNGEPGGSCRYGMTKEICQKDVVLKCAIGGLPGFPNYLYSEIGSAHGLFDRHAAFRDMFADDVSGAFLNQVQTRLHDNLAVNDPKCNSAGGYLRPFDPDRIRAAAEALRTEITDAQ